jgi:DNA invertase Pin-like site-specific DNA recombinase
MIEIDTVERLVFGPKCTAVAALSRVPTSSGYYAIFIDDGGALPITTQYSSPYTDNSVLSSLAKVEAQKISDRTKAGMARAKAKGIKIGRPRLRIELRQKIAQLAAKGETVYAIAKSLSIDRHTAAKYAT